MNFREHTIQTILFLPYFVGIYSLKCLHSHSYRQWRTIFRNSSSCHQTLGQVGDHAPLKLDHIWFLNYLFVATLIQFFLFLLPISPIPSRLDTTLYSSSALFFPFNWNSPVWMGVWNDLLLWFLARAPCAHQIKSYFELLPTL